MSLAPAAQRVADAAAALGLTIEVRDFPEGTRVSVFSAAPHSLVAARKAIVIDLKEIT